MLLVVSLKGGTARHCLVWILLRLREFSCTYRLCMHTYQMPALRQWTYDIASTLHVDMCAV